MRIALSDDPWGRNIGHAARVLLDDDRVGPCGTPACLSEDGGDEEYTPAMGGWQLLVRQRGERGRDADGTALYGWADVWSGKAQVSADNRGLALNRGRTETSDQAGQSFETVTALLPGAVSLDLTETAVAWDDDGHRWEITAVEPGAGGTQLRMQRVVDDAT
ncbi:hypothetical protein [Actinomycetospora termitidis]|uniref:Uncharacterized protein n=1 Tax=Actinomycetospora termitidis TaxID=3053470 RepID=A0ABT7MFI0_9PSEU|nr:hypothetical protein [Actinomycetospora sp. Odt1-22]MDL5159410.1 hypothetical protein [Actinomycetospora sp. Odt1-22]